jgi:hypothetical protein
MDQVVLAQPETRRICSWDVSNLATVSSLSYDPSELHFDVSFENTTQKTLA